LSQSNSGGATAGNTVGYCADLRRITILALTKERFASVLGSAREGSFSTLRFC